MKNLISLLIAGTTIYGGLSVCASAQEPCTVAPLSASDIGAGPGALNEALACIEARLQALEADSGQPGAPQLAAFEPIGQTTLFETVQVSLDYASVVDGNQVLLEYSITNNGTEPLLAIIAAFQDSSVSVRGEARPRPFRVEGFAVCPTYQTNVTQNCIERTSEEKWTLLSPGITYSFQIATDARHGDIDSDMASANVRLIIDDGEEARFQNISFGRVPLDG